MYIHILFLPLSKRKVNMLRLNRLLELVTSYKGYLKCLHTLSPRKPTENGTAASQNSNKETEHKSCRVALLGALTTTGKILALLLKQNPLISHIFLYDSDHTNGLAADLNHIDTHSSVTPYHNEFVRCAVQNADIIVMLGLEAVKPDANIQQKLNIEGKRLITLATVSALHAPKAIFVDCVIPLSITLPLISEIYRRNQWYHPGKIVGSVAQQQMQINSFYAQHCCSDPNLVHVPLLGGPEEDLMLPLFSRATPCPVQLPDTISMINLFRKLEPNAPPTANSEQKHEYTPYGNAFAINRLVSTIALGLLGDTSAIATAFVRTNFVETCRHLVSTVKFGTNGISHNYGIPKLTRFELSLFEKITMDIHKREYIARKYLAKCHTLLANDELNACETLYFPSTVKYSPPEDTSMDEC